MAEDFPIRLDLSEAFAAIDVLFQTFAAGGEEAAQVVADAIRSQISDLVANVEVTLADADALRAHVDEIITEQHPELEVTIDPAALQAVMGEAIAEAGPQEIPVALVPEGTPEVKEAGDAAEVASGQVGELAGAFTAVKGASSLAKGEVGAAANSVGAFGSTAGNAVGAGLAFAAVLGEMVQEASQAEAAAAQTTRVFGEFANRIETIRFGTLVGGLSDLALQLGADDDAMRVTLANIGQLAQAEGESQAASAALASEFAGLATVIAATHPGLGTTSDVLDNLIPRLARGGRFVQEMGLSFTQADVAAEAARQGLGDNVSELSILERATVALTLANRQLGESAATDVAQGAELALVRLRSFRQEVRESLESAGAPLLEGFVDLGEDLLPVITSLAQALGQVGEVAVDTLGPVVEDLAPSLVIGFKAVAAILDTLGPLFTVVGQVIATVLSPVRLLSDEIEDLAGFVGDALPDAFNTLREAAADALEPIIDLVNKMISAFNKIPFVGDIGHIDTSGLHAANEEGAKQVETWQAIGAQLAITEQGYTGVAGSVDGATAALDEFTLAQAAAATPFGGGELFSDLATGVEDANGALLESRGLADQAFVALLRLGDDGAQVVDELAAAFERGSLSQSEFSALASRFGLSLGELTAIEQRVREETDRTAESIQEFADDVDSAIGGITSATKTLDDEGNANIDSFVGELETSLTQAADFANHVAELVGLGADALAQAFLDAGPESAGALEELLARGGSAVTEMEGRLDTAAGAVEEAKGRIVTASTEGAAEGSAALSEIKPDENAIRQGIDGAMLAAQAALDQGAINVRASASAVGRALAEGMAGGFAAGIPEIQRAVDGGIDAALLSAQAAAQIGSPSRLFARDVGFPLTEGIAEGIRSGFFHVDNAIEDVILGAQRQAEADLDTALGALRAGRGVQQAEERLGDLRQEQADLLARQAALPAEQAAAQRDLNAALVEAAAVTAREQQAIDRAAASVAQIRAALDFQASAGPQQLDQAQRILASEQSDLDRLRANLATQQNNALLGTGDTVALRAAQDAFNQAQRRVTDQQRSVDELTRKLNENKFSTNDLQVAVEDLALAQSNAVAATDGVNDAERRLADIEEEARDIKRQLVDVTNELPDAQLALIESTAAAAKAGDQFNRTGLASLSVLADIARQAGFTDKAIADLTRTWGGLSSTIATNLGGGAFGGSGLVDIGSIINPSGGPRFVDAGQALNELNFVRGINGQGALSMQQAPWNINIYQANDPALLAGTLNAIQGLAGVR